MPDISVLHISDLHRDPANPIGNLPLIDSLERDYEHYVKVESPIIRPPDIVVVSGDIIYGVKRDSHDPKSELARQYDEALEFLNDLTHRILNGDKERVVIVPGNHDVSASHAFKSLQKVAITEESKKELVSKLFSHNSTLRWAWSEFELYEIYDRTVYDARFEAFSEFYRQFYDNKRDYSLDPGEQFDIFDFPEFNITFAAFNSCHNNDILNRQGAIHPNCIAAAAIEFRDPKYQDRLRIGVWHHNTEGSPADFSYMDPDILQNLIDCGFSLGFHGHQHKPRFIDRRYEHGGDRKIIVISAGTVCGQAAPRFGRAYNVVEIDLGARTGRLHLREMQNDKLDLPIWGQRSLPPNKTTFLNFDFDPPPEPLVRVSQEASSLSHAQRLYENGDYEEAAVILNPIATDNDLARRILLECYIKSNDFGSIVANFDPAQSYGEIIALMDALWTEANLERLTALLNESVVAHSVDPSVIELSKKYQARLNK